MKIIIPGRLPGMNEIITAAKKGSGKYQPYAMMKDQYTDIVTWLAKGLPKREKVKIKITWYEPNMKRDIDNIAAGIKFILDGLVKAGVIKDDNQRYVKSIENIFETDTKNPRIEVQIEDIN